MASEEDRATGSMHKKFGKVRLRGFPVMRAYRQTDLQATRNTDYSNFATLTG